MFPESIRLAAHAFEALRPVGLQIGRSIFGEPASRDVVGIARHDADHTVIARDAVTARMQTAAALRGRDDVQLAWLEDDVAIT